MISFPHCKVNLGLYITAKRTDGYHDLETVFFPVPIYDVLEFVKAPKQDFQLTGLPVIGLAADNLCVKAYTLMKEKFPELPALSIHLHKLIPMGAGLGGGSSDGAFMLRMLNTQFNLGLGQAELIDLALQLGSDCPYFILDQPAYAQGRGERLSPLPLSLSSWWMVLMNPGIHVSTANAFSGISPRACPVPLADKILEPVENWKDWLQNDFEATVCKAHPQISALKQSLYDAGAAYAAMSGSGSTVYGLFPEKPGISFPSGLLTYVVQIK